TTRRGNPTTAPKPHPAWSPIFGATGAKKSSCATTTTPNSWFIPPPLPPLTDFTRSCTIPFTVPQSLGKTRPTTNRPIWVSGWARAQTRLHVLACTLSVPWPLQVRRPFRLLPHRVLRQALRRPLRRRLMYLLSHPCCKAKTSV